MTPDRDTPLTPAPSTESTGPSADLVPAPPPVAAEVFGTGLDRAAAYAELLATEGVIRGLIGPREVSRIWDRHLLNCAVLGELVSRETATRVVDVGTGAGLPGIVLAVARPDLELILVEPMARRVAFLEEVVERLELGNARVVRARAEELIGVESAPIVTARAVAPLDRLARWTLPLTEPGGRVLAIKGASAHDEIAIHQKAVRRAGGSDIRVALCGVGLIDPPTTVIEMVRRGGPGRRGAGEGER